MLRTLDIKVWRELLRLRGQVVAIAMVIACGVGVYLGLSSTMHSLQRARSSNYAEQRFAHVFAELERAPLHLIPRLQAIEGVQVVQTRIVRGVTLELPGMVEAGSARLVSIPERGRPELNDVKLRLGRMPQPGHSEEVLVSEAFFEAHGFRLDDELPAIVNGSRVAFRIVGVALSPEFTYTVAPGQLFPDDRLHGILWARRKGLAAAFDLEGAFNNLALRLAPQAHEAAVLAAVDRILEPYGGRGAYPRRDQVSAFFLENELTQLQGFAVTIPLLFLGVAAFLLHIVFQRLIATQRSDIAALKAFGYHDREVGWHYAKLVGAIVWLGSVAGWLLGGYLGSAMTSLYADYYRFPELPFQLDPLSPFLALGVAGLAAGWGTARAIRQTVGLAPAEAMRPPAPLRYRRTLLERLGWVQKVPIGLRTVLREIERKPWRAVLSVAGVSMATALTILMAFSADSIRYMLQVQFGLSQREDVQISLLQTRSQAVLSEIRNLPGVQHAEPYRSVPVEFRAGARVKRVSLTGLDPAGELLALYNTSEERIPIARGGLTLSRKLAEVLGVRPGDSLAFRWLEGARSTHSATVAQIVDTYVGLSAYMPLDELASALGEPPTLNGARLLVDPSELASLYAEVKATPMIAGIAERDRSLRLVQGMLDENMGTMIWISLSFALVMAFAVLYNTIRITLAERSRELATMRVLGYRRREVSAILMGEMGLVLLVAIPLGLWMGHVFSSALVRSPGYDTEQFRLPFVIYPSTYAIGALGILASGLVSGLGAWRRLDRFDMVEVLKSRD